ncbi:MAG: hypothetical protein KKD31_04800 [Bacteroidetes bacterium]|nr:hypothetical protein [Bacteroidota bacterium]
MPNRILFVFEGERTENQITDNLTTNNFFGNNTIIQCAYCTDIYQLHKEISNDEDLDTFSLLKEKPQNSHALSAYDRSDFAEIYLFFDYDGHANTATDEKIERVLTLFNEETSSGKIFISYPMVEALKHYSDSINFNKLKVKAKENIKYKNLVHFQCKKSLRDLTSYSKSTWIQLIELHLMKMNYIVNDDYSLPKSNISQNDIFLNQLEKYINVDCTVAVLSSFPIFLFDYYGIAYITGLLSK